jgi:hypothetical protein
MKTVKGLNIKTGDLSLSAFGDAFKLSAENNTWKTKVSPPFLRRGGSALSFV